MSWPKRLKKTLSSFSMATARSRSSSPSAQSSRIPWGSSVMPTPSSFTWRALSSTRHERPRACMESANARPAIPPPTTMVSNLLRLDSRGLHHLRPAHCLEVHLLAQLLRGAGEDLHPLLGERSAHFRERQDSLHVGVDLRGECCRRAGGRPQRVPDVGIRVAEPELGERRNLGCERRARRASGGERVELARLHVRNRDVHGK